MFTITVTRIPSLREGNVFSHVCLFPVGEGDPVMPLVRHRSHGTPSLPGTCSNLFTWEPPPSPLIPTTWETNPAISCQHTLGFHIFPQVPVPLEDKNSGWISRYILRLKGFLWRLHKQKHCIYFNNLCLRRFQFISIGSLLSIFFSESSHKTTRYCM